jgi:DNA-directed RNA polymerase subunit E'/Rpb7
MMRRNLLSVFVGMFVILFCFNLAYGAEVVQGKVLKIEKEGALVTIEEYDLNFSKEHPYGRPTGATSVYDTSKATVGMPAQVGDILRIAYTVKGKERVAVKVMNVSKQDLMKK